MEEENGEEKGVENMDGEGKATSGEEKAESMEEKVCGRVDLEEEEEKEKERRAL